ncbi:MAG: hypothetical protein ACJ78U_17200, partial [Myxococcales bacterium]
SPPFTPRELLAPKVSASRMDQGVNRDEGRRPQGSRFTPPIVARLPGARPRRMTSWPSLN